MSKMRQESLDLVGGTSFGRYPEISTEETFNFMISEDTLVPYPGHELAAQLDPNALTSRAIFRSTRYDHLIVVIQQNVYAVSLNLQYSIVGTLETSEGFVNITENLAQQIAIQDGQKIYVYNWDDHSFNSVDPGFEPIYVNAIDNYVIAAARGSNAWYLSDLGNALSWPNDQNTVGALQTKADNVIAIARLDRLIYIMGEAATEIWTDVGASPFPFKRDNTVSIDYGTVSPASVAQGFGMVVWLAVNEQAAPTLVYSVGGKVKELLNDGLEFRFDELTDPENCVASIFEEYGHVIYHLTFPQDNLSYAYDFHEGKFYTLTDENLDFHIAFKVVDFGNKLYFSSLVDGNLYNMSSEITTYDGQIIPRIRKTKNFRTPGATRFITRDLSITQEQGFNAEPARVLLSLSRDGGISFGTIQAKDLNPLGRRANKLMFYHLGSANDLVFQLRWETKGRVVVRHGTFTIQEQL